MSHEPAPRGTWERLGETPVYGEIMELLLVSCAKQRSCGRPSLGVLGVLV